MKKLVDTIRCAINHVNKSLRHFQRKGRLYRRPYDYMYDMYYDEFDDASEEDIRIYLAQTSAGR